MNFLLVALSTMILRSTQAVLCAFRLLLLAADL